MLLKVRHNTEEEEVYIAITYCDSGGDTTDVFVSQRLNQGQSCNTVNPLGCLNLQLFQRRMLCFGLFTVHGLNDWLHCQTLPWLSPVVVQHMVELCKAAEKVQKHGSNKHSWWIFMDWKLKDKKSTCTGQLFPENQFESDYQKSVNVVLGWMNMKSVCRGNSDEHIQSRLCVISLSVC